MATKEVKKEILEQQLWDAIETKSDVSIIQSIIQKNPSIVSSTNTSDDGWTALHYAAKEGDVEVVKLLIEVY